MLIKKNNSLSRRFLKRFYLTFVYPFIVWYIRKERSYNYKGLDLTIFPGVFHPAFFFSTKFFYSFISRQDLRNASCLEIGCGSGILSLLMLRMNGKVTALDINEKAIENTRHNFLRNREQFQSELILIKTDLFDEVPPQQFQFIIIAPPYFFADPKNDNEYAWFCGTDGAYFYKLFSQLGSFLSPEAQIYMILADNCDLERICKIAATYGFIFELVSLKKVWWEDNYIFRINKQPAD